MSSYLDHAELFKSANMTPSDMNIYVNSSYSMLGSAMLILIDYTSVEQLKGKPKMLSRLLMENLESVMNVANMSLESEETEKYYGRDVEIFYNLFNRPDMNSSTRLKMVHALCKFALELTNACRTAISMMAVRGKVVEYVHDKALKCEKMAKTLCEHQKATDRQWPTMYNDVAEICYSMMDESTKGKG